MSNFDLLLGKTFEHVQKGKGEQKDTTKQIAGLLSLSRYQKSKSKHVKQICSPKSEKNREIIP